MPKPTNAVPINAIDVGSGIPTIGRPGVITESEQVIAAPMAVWVQVSEMEAVWPRNVDPVLVSPVTDPLNCSEMLPFVVAPLGTISTDETLVKEKIRSPVVSVKLSGPGVVLSVSTLNVAALPVTRPASAKVDGVVVLPISSLPGRVLVAVADVIFPVLTEKGPVAEPTPNDRTGSAIGPA